MPYAATVITAVLSAFHHTQTTPALDTATDETKPVLTRAA
jgi:hypothetical protein